MPEKQEMNAGRQEEDKDFHLCPCNNLHGCMKSFDHGSVEIPQGKQANLQCGPPLTRVRVGKVHCYILLEQENKAMPMKK